VSPFDFLDEVARVGPAKDAARNTYAQRAARNAQRIRATRNTSAQRATHPRNAQHIRATRNAQRTTVRPVGTDDMRLYGIGVMCRVLAMDGPSFMQSWPIRRDATSCVCVR